jgi:hypothetical protein
MTVPLAVALLAACSGKTAATGGPTASAPPSGEGTGSAPSLPPDTVDPGGTGPSYPGHGFVVHEWGTNTIVVGSDGSMQRGLHHEEEDLPSFVYDRRRAELATDPTTVKMETPVTYFYSDVPLAPNVSVSFPQGVLSQWYPKVASFYPPTVKDKGDPALDPKYPFANDGCKQELGGIVDGNLSWGPIEVLARGVTPAAPDAPLDRFTWSHARNVAANGVRVNGQEERFLFYRGLGTFPIPVTVTSQTGSVTLANGDAKEKVGAAFVLDVGSESAAFSVVRAGIPAGGSITMSVPSQDEPLDAYAQALATALVTELDGAGLYHDESIAMVKTWARQWFRTPGVRVLYLAPQAWTDRQIPLAIDPAPQETVRVMVIRVEALTPAQETGDLAAVPGFDGDAAAQQASAAHFKALGRFAEPRLRRAIQLHEAKAPGAMAFLDTISGADVAVRAGE